jgi:hypothetical protein
VDPYAGLRLLRTILQSSTADGSRWPIDTEFQKECLTAEIYPGRLDAPKAKSFLAELERALRDAALPEDPFVSGLDQLDVDHILPQSWAAHWPLADGSQVTSAEPAEVDLLVRSGLDLNDRQRFIAQRQAAVRNLGNLTLLNLSVNRQVQNHAFTQKRDLLIANTNLRLNIPLIPLTVWDETGIAKRRQMLSQTALKLWSGPKP